jgi:hypothetical protein
MISERRMLLVIIVALVIGTGLIRLPIPSGYAGGPAPRVTCQDFPMDYCVPLSGLDARSRYTVRALGLPLGGTQTNHGFYTGNTLVAMFEDTLHTYSPRTYDLATVANLPRDWAGYALIRASAPITATLLPGSLFLPLIVR